MTDNQALVTDLFQCRAKIEIARDALMRAGDALYQAHERMLETKGIEENYRNYLIENTPPEELGSNDAKRKAKLDALTRDKQAESLKTEKLYRAAKHAFDDAELAWKAAREDLKCLTLITYALTGVSPELV